MASTSLALFSLLLLLPLLVSAKGGFSIELIHRDSPRSPLHDPSRTLFDRVREDARRSIARAEHLRNAFSLAASSGGTYQSPVIPADAIYLMEVDVGTPANKIFGVVDTGSDLIWTDCKPCKDCYPQEAPLFDPKKSSTYRDISCGASTCSYLPEPGCSTNGSTCQYTYKYADGSHTSGNLASETFTFHDAGNRSVKIPKVTFGCSHDSQGSFDNSTAGIVGLGTGNLSLVSQLGSVIDKKFSYCFVPYAKTSASSKISFGADAVVSGRDVVSTPLVDLLETLYTVPLQSLTVDNDSFSVNSFAVVVDSGTTLTILDPTLVQSLELKLTKIIHLPRVQDPEGTFGLCFDVSKNPNEQFPDITFRFDGGAALTLSSLNTFVHYDKNTVCLAIVAQDDLGVIGNIAQQNFHVGYDLVNQRLSFAPADCTKS